MLKGTAMGLFVSAAVIFRVLSAVFLLGLVIGLTLSAYLL